MLTEVNDRTHGLGGWERAGSAKWLSRGSDLSGVSKWEGLYIYIFHILKGISPSPSLHLVEREGGERRVHVILLNLSKHLEEFWLHYFAMFFVTLILHTLDVSWSS